MSAGVCSRSVVVLGSLALLALTGFCCSAQEIETWAAGEEPALGFELPDFSSRTVPGEAVVDLADFICGYVSDVGYLPDFTQVQTADGGLRRISAAEAFILLARTAHLWEALGALPETVPLAPDELRPPLIDAEDVPDWNIDLSEGREVPTDQFLANVGETVRWVDRLHAIPTAVWVNGERLSAAEYLAGLAICIQHAYWEGTLYDSLFLPWYGSPHSWVGIRMEQSGDTVAALSAEDESWEETDAEWFDWAEAEEEGSAPLLVVEPAEALPPPPPPHLTVFPRSGSVVSGKVDLVAGYVGPAPRFVVFAVDGATRAIVNVPPYSFRWDASGAAPGPHTVRVQVLGEGDAVLAEQFCGFSVVPPESALSDQDLVDDL